MKIVSEILEDVNPMKRHIWVTVAMVFVGGWVLSRVFPGAAMRVGLRPRPILPAWQNGFYEPLGLVPVIPGVAPSAVAPTATPALTQAQIGQAIVQATQASLPVSSGDILQNITSGNA